MKLLLDENLSPVHAVRLRAAGHDAIYYEMQASTVKVKAVLDCRRDPAWIRRKLRP